MLLEDGNPWLAVPNDALLYALAEHKGRRTMPHKGDLHLPAEFLSMSRPSCIQNAGTRVQVGSLETQPLELDV